MKSSFVHALRRGAVALAWLLAVTHAMAQPTGEAAVARRAAELREAPGDTGLLGGSQQRATTSTSAIGIRGLGAEDIARAQPNLQAVGQMESMRQSEGDARDFAGKSALSSASVEPLPAPRTRAGGSNPSNPGNPP